MFGNILKTFLFSYLLLNIILNNSQHLIKSSLIYIYAYVGSRYTNFHFMLFIIQCCAYWKFINESLVS